MFYTMSHRARRSLFAACCLVALCPDGEGGGGGGGAPEKKEEKSKKIELTQEELDAKVESALAAERKKTADAAATKKAEDERKAEEEKGNFKKLAETSDARLKETQAELAKMQLGVKVRDHIAEKHKGYESCAKWIIPTVDVKADASDADVAKAIKTACDDYVAANPRTLAAGAPASPAGGLRRGSAPPKEGTPQPKNNDPVKAVLNRFQGPPQRTGSKN